MADNFDTPSFNFGIENTMEMGLGNAELLSDLLGPETATSDPNDLEPIIKEVEEPVATPSKKAPVKTIIPKEPEEEVVDQDLLAGFLEGDETDDAPEEITKVKETVAEGDEDDQPTSQFSALSRDLLRLGVFTKDDEAEDVEISTPEEFLERFKAEKQKGAGEIVNNFIGQFGEDYQKAFNAIYVNGVDPKEYFGTYNKIVNFAELDLAVEDNQVAVMRQALADQGFDPEDITTEVDRLKNYGDLETVAAKHHKVLVKREAVKLQELEQQAGQELQQKNAIKNQYIQNVNTILQEKLKTKEFDGIPINPKLVNELQDFLLVDKYKTSNGETLTDFDRAILDMKRPENHAMKIKVALLLKLLEKDPTLSTIQQSGVTKKSDKLFTEFARQTSKDKVPLQGKNNSWSL